MCHSIVQQCIIVQSDVQAYPVQIHLLIRSRIPVLAGASANVTPPAATTSGRAAQPASGLAATSRQRSPSRQSQAGQGTSSSSVQHMMQPNKRQSQARKQSLAAAKHLQGQGLGWGLSLGRCQSQVPARNQGGCRGLKWQMLLLPWLRRRNPRQTGTRPIPAAASGSDTSRDGYHPWNPPQYQPAEPTRADLQLSPWEDAVIYDSGLQRNYARAHLDTGESCWLG